MNNYVKLGDICQISSSKRIFEDEYRETGVPFIRGLEISNKSLLDDDTKFECYISKERYNEIKQQYHIPQIGDILITAVGTIGNLAYINKNKEFYFKDGNVIMFSDFKQNVYSKYLYYFMKSPFFKKQLNCSMIGAVQKALTMVMLKKVELPLPPYDKQKFIANILSSIDDKIELNNKINKELEQMAKTLYDYWFVQFEFPDGIKGAYKSSNGPMTYNEVLKREIPTGWKVETLFKNSLTNLIKTGIPEFEGEKIYLPTACISEDKITDTTTKITYKNRESRANMMPIPNSVWFAKMKNTNKHLYFGDYSTERINKIILSTGMCGLECPDYALEYLWNFIQNKQFEDTKDVLASGAIQPAINNNDLNSIYILIPDTNTLKMYSQKVKSLLQMKYNNEEENFKLEKLRDFLLPMLMNGQIKVG